jgi:hypothetical protein
MNAIATGHWLTRERVTLIPAISAFAGVAMVLFLWLGGNGTVDPFGKPIGSDFAAFWQAGHIATQGDPARAWDQQVLNDSITRTHGVEYGAAWIYPPPFMLLIYPLGAMPYLTALLIWQLLSLAAIAVVLKSILKSRRDTLVAMASPLTALVLANGQNSFLTAALLGFGLLLMERRPILAGALFGGLSYKPQLGLIIGPLLLLSKNWRAIAGGVAAVVILILLSLLFFGAESWTAWQSSLRYGRHYMEEGSVGFFKSASLFATMRNWGAGETVAYTVQAIGTIAAILLIWTVRNSPLAVRAVAACAGAALSTPYLLDYDMAVVGIGAAFLYAEGRRTDFLPYERSAIAFMWVAPWFSRPAAEYALLPLGPIAMLALMTLAWRRASEHGHPAVDV